MTDPAPRYAVNEHAPDADHHAAERALHVAPRGQHVGVADVRLSERAVEDDGGIEHPKHPDGIAYAKPAGVSLEEMSVEDIVITDIPYGRVLHGARATSVGHQMNREILRLRPDVGCVIHPTFIQDTNCIVMKRHGITVLGRTVSECYHRVTTYASEVKRQILVELLCTAKGTKPEAMSEDEMRWMFEHGDDIVYPALVRKDATRPRGQKASRIRAR